MMPPSSSAILMPLAVMWKAIVSPFEAALKATGVLKIPVMPDVDLSDCVVIVTGANTGETPVPGWGWGSGLGFGNNLFTCIRYNTYAISLVYHTCKEGCAEKVHCAAGRGGKYHVFVAACPPLRSSRGQPHSQESTLLYTQHNDRLVNTIVMDGHFYIHRSLQKAYAGTR